MREKLFRTLAGALFLLSIATLVLAAMEGDRFGLLTLFAFLCFAPSLAIYAIRGESAAYRVLIPGIALFNLPSTLLELLLRGVVQTPNVDDVFPEEPDDDSLPTSDRDWPGSA